jgi:serine/threonine-protein kinase
MVGSDADSLAPGSMLGRYEIRGQLGRGGMGCVYEAVHRDLKKRVAVKVLSAALASNEEAKQRFLREGEAASRIRHPHVVDVTDVGTDGVLTYLVMEFLDGEDLSRRIGRGPLTIQETANIMLPVLAGVAAAHDEGVVHRDLKPENIFLANVRHRSGVQPKVLDFGVSKLTDPNAMALTGTAATFGTPFYIPPEQLRGARQADHRSDQYALGVVLYECVTGQRPFQGDNVFTVLRAIGDGDYPPPRAVRPDLPLAFEAIIVRAMRLDPADRFPSLRALGAALLPFAPDTARLLWAEMFASGEGAPVAPPPGIDARVTPPLQPPGIPQVTTLGTANGQRFAPPASRWRGLIAGVLVFGAVGIGAAVFVLRRTPAAASPAVIATPVAPTVAAPAPKPRFNVDVATTPASASLELDGAAVGTGALHTDLAKDGAEHRLIARAPGFREAVVRFTDQPPPARIALDAVPVERPAASPPKPSPARAHRQVATPVRAPAPGAPPVSVPRTNNGAPVID